MEYKLSHVSSLNIQQVLCLQVISQQQIDTRIILSAGPEFQSSGQKNHGNICMYWELLETRVT